MALLIRQTGDFDLAEECAQEAFAEAVESWAAVPPHNPVGWLVTTARRRAVDRLRRQITERRKLALVTSLRALEEGPDEKEVADERLRLIFTCCHPALPMEARIALTLRTVAGLTTTEIARAFLVSEPSMAQRLVRAKRKIREAGIPYRVPPDHLLAERTDGVLLVLYVMFTEGYSPTSGAGVLRADVAAAAIALTRALVELLPDEPEAEGLLALMVLHHARRSARTDRAGDPVLLDDQDRALWDHEAIAEGVRLVGSALRRGRPGPYQVQAAIAALHATAPDAASTDRAQIAALYGELVRLAPSPVAELNRAVAVADVAGPAAGLAILDALAGRLEGYVLLPAARGELLHRLGRDQEAAESLRAALALATRAVDRRQLERRLADLTHPPARGSLPPPELSRGPAST